MSHFKFYSALRKKETNNFIGLNKKSNITNKRNEYG